MVLRRSNGDVVLEPFVDPDILARGRAARVRAKDPQGAELLERLDRLATLHRSLAGSLEHAILEQVPSSRPDAIAEQAK